MPTLLVTDANILIDLALVKEHLLLFLPDHAVHTTYDVYFELSPQQVDSWAPFVKNGRLQLADAPESLIIQFRSELSKRLSDPDLTILALAEDRQAILLTGEKLMTRTFRGRGYEAHGMLWLLDLHEATGTYTSNQLHEILTGIMRINERMPAKLCETRLKRWKGN